MRMHLRHIRRSPTALSMQEPIEAARDGSALTVMDVIPDDFALDEHFEQQDEGRRLRRLVDTLTARERQVILLRYGLGGQPPLNSRRRRFWASAAVMSPALKSARWNCCAAR